MKVYENILALDGGSDGLDLIKNIIDNLPCLLKRRSSLWLEIDDSHPLLIKEIMKNYENLQFVAEYKDQYGQIRFCQIQYD